MLALLFCSSVQAQQPIDTTNQKVGLVLSGGGAKGLAHIGVLKVIDSLGIKIDYIGGTSMGAIIGGLYASGYNGKQLDSIFHAVNFGKLIQDEFPRSAKTFYEKDDSERYAITVPFENFKVGLPSGLSKGQNVFNLMAQLTKHVSHISDFKKLPIPFFCIATDVETGKALILDKGYLADAMSASGSFPSLFEPVELDGQLLIDGGVANNYPVAEVKKMGATIIIGIDVQDNLKNREKLSGALDIMLQISNYRTVDEMKYKSKQTDVYINPDVTAYNVISFDQGNQIIKNGEIAALQNITKLTEIVTKQESPFYKPKLKIQTPEFVLNGIEIGGDQEYPRAYTLGKLRLKTPSIITFKKLDQGITNLAATGNFKSIRYRFVNQEDGDKILLNINKNNSTSFIKLGLHFDDLYKSAALLNFTKKRFLFDNDVASLDLIVGDNLRYNFEYYVDKGFYWSIGIRSQYNTFQTDVAGTSIAEVIDGMLNVNRVELVVSDFNNQFYLQTVLKEEFAFTVGAEHNRLEYSTETLVSGSNSGEVFFEKSDYLSIFSSLKLDTYDSKYFPTRGFYFNGKANLYLISSDYNDNFSEFAVAKAKIGTAFPITKNVALNIESEGGFKAGISDVSSFDFIFGGYGNNLINNFIPFIGYDFLSFSGDSYVKGSIRLDYEFHKKNHLNFIANFANTNTSIFENGEWFTAPDYSGYGIGYSLESFLGPIEIKYTWSPEIETNSVFFNLGFWF